MISREARWIALVALAATLFAVVGAQAQTLGQHPAVLVKQTPISIDPNTFIVAHPARGTSKRGHAGHEHPALTARRELTAAGIDANTFLVQPPASTSWTHDAAEPALLAVTGTR